MKNYKLKNASKLFLSCALFLGMTACSDFLKEEDPSNLTPESFYKTAKDADVAIAAAYADTRFIGEVLINGFSLPGDSTFR